MEKIIIDNCVVTNYDNGICVRSIKLENKLNKNTNINNLKTISYGNRQKDNKIIQQLCNAKITFQEIFTIA